MQPVLDGGGDAGLVLAEEGDVRGGGAWAGAGSSCRVAAATEPTPAAPRATPAPAQPMTARRLSGLRPEPSCPASVTVAGAAVPASVPAGVPVCCSFSASIGGRPFSVLNSRMPWRPLGPPRRCGGGWCAVPGRPGRAAGRDYLTTTAAASFDSGSPSEFTASEKVLRSASVTLS